MLAMFSVIVFFFLLLGCVGEGNSLENLSNTTKVESRECFSNSDCVHVPSCCHQNAMPCISKEKLKEMNVNFKCEGVVCTMDCRPCTICKCVEGKCKAEVIGGCC